MAKKRPDKLLVNMQKRLEEIEKRLNIMLDTIEMLSYGVATHQELLGALAEDAKRHMDEMEKNGDK